MIGESFLESAFNNQKSLYCPYISLAKWTLVEHPKPCCYTTKEEVFNLWVSIFSVKGQRVKFFGFVVHMWSLSYIHFYFDNSLIMQETL